MLRVVADGRSATLSPLPISLPGNLMTGGVALSPDGRLLAMAVQSCHAGTCQDSGIRVITLATGAASTWTTRARGVPTDVSWDGNGQIFFTWNTRYRLLSITGASRDLLAARNVAPAAVAGSAPAALVSPDGRAIITSTVESLRDGHGRNKQVMKIVELSLSTGRLLRVLHEATVIVASSNPAAGATGDDCEILALGPTGVHALVYCLGYGTSGFGRVDGTRFTPLPGLPSRNAISETWATSVW